MTNSILLVAGGLVLLALGGELLVRGAVGMAARIGISPLLAGLTIVGFGTSMPELATSVQAALEGAPGIAVGNVVGSNIANMLLILGVAGLVAPIAVNPASFKRDALAMGGATLLATGAVMLGVIGLVPGLVLAAALAGYIWWAYKSESAAHDDEARRHEAEAEDRPVPPDTGPVVLGGMILAGLAAAIFGARLLVDGAVVLAAAAGVSQSVIGLTVVAIGTSLPELIACVVAVFRKHGDVALGNVVGSNIYNLCGILGVTATIHPIAVPAEIARIDIWVLAGVTMLLIVQLRSGWKLSRLEAALLLVLYAAYTTFLAVR
ncbi:calcium/sodium antiporter [Erythrobacter dokdonensis]|uniref:K+-dependent Na+/Ca+ exchanger related-protein n=1 Tax=Erythrobacter dokdonensis DSW-74 TaxID=1300349 RepID=A0A1A7BC69_9SPHN|nr:calcium/sodium antiporter [Erythrobacter dokdonensis]OBV10094.1 K+-dependent Na+/Ca+ exchanger related-protein [Erythrobacter dokdonensis DSW-74]